MGTRSSDLDRLAAGFFAAQHGLLTRRQALDLGFTPRMVDRRLAAGRWDVVHTGVYRLAGAPVRDEQRLAAAVLGCGPDAALSHRSATVLHGTRAFAADVVEVLVPGGRRPRPAGVVVHRVDRLDAAHVVEVRGIAVTSPARTLVDLGAVVPDGIVARVMEEWLADRKIEVRGVVAAAEATARRGARGPATARRLLEARALGDEAGDSTDEHLVATVLAAYGAPPPVHHHLVRLTCGDVVELDAAYVEERLGIELHGFHVKTRARRTFERALERVNELQADGWLVLQYTPAQVRARPWAVAREIDRLRRARATRPRA